MSFNWDDAALSILGKYSTEIVNSAGFAELAPVIESFFDQMSGEGTSEALQEIVQQLEQINQTLQAMQSDLALIEVEVAMVNVTAWINDIETMYDRMVTIVSKASVPPSSTTQTDITNLVSDIEEKSLADASGVYNAMTQENGTGQPSVLALAFQFLLTKGMDALDLYGSMKSFSTRYLLSSQKASTLLTFASKARSDDNDTAYAQQIAAYVGPWNDVLESGSSPIMGPMFTAWARAMIAGANNGSAAPQATNIGWGVHSDDNRSVIAATRSAYNLGTIQAPANQPQPPTSPDSIFTLVRVPPNTAQAMFKSALDRMLKASSTKSSGTTGASSNGSFAKPKQETALQIDHPAYTIVSLSGHGTSAGWDPIDDDSVTTTDPQDSTPWFVRLNQTGDYFNIFTLWDYAIYWVNNDYGNVYYIDEDAPAPDYQGNTRFEWTLNVI